MAKPAKAPAGANTVTVGIPLEEDVPRVHKLLIAAAEPTASAATVDELREVYQKYPELYRTVGDTAFQALRALGAAVGDNAIGREAVDLYAAELRRSLGL